jgi:prepilin-type N-terminal cleavage/methylation domain-containing protein
MNQSTKGRKAYQHRHLTRRRIIKVTAERDNDGGFTLVEILVALVILGIVLAALGPVFYGALRATSMTNQRSVANGLAVAANEQLRSVPYNQVGYVTSAAVPPSVAVPTLCTGQNPVLLTDVTTPIPATNTVTVPAQGSPPGAGAPVQYTLTRCIYWVDSSIAQDTQAYKKSVVTVSWIMQGASYQVSQTSALYPGGAAAYTGTPGSTTTTTPPPTPSIPTNVAAHVDSVNTTNQIDVSWTASSPTPASYYIVQYSSTYSGSGTLASPFTSSPLISGTSWPAPVAPGATYYFQVVAVAADGVTMSAPSSSVQQPIAQATTSPAATTCTLTNLVVQPTSAMVDKNGSLVGVPNNTFALSVNASGPCQNVTVAYNPTGTGTPPAPASVTGTIPGTLTGSTLPAQWAPGNQTFTVNVNGTTQYAPLVQVQVVICQEKGNSGKC